ncbi:hypothetical protein HAP41_0000009930 [Bradyrhizobium barranii subsp. apii]|uniref:Uncharacterized protein n=1 Tax=Bradyrhizobium barranii subsp. apii TaxID=2819348 RepID=A0A8T5VPC4_9BRAD|nr:hypothetical protein [Bradyrhizobium barranii]UPT89256.1 hypothetical protein HAP41_0000009930 [Bradyrhizobium barranii subsp. apii]
MTRTEIEAAIFASLKRTARWRRAVAQRFPNDPRNLAAAERLGDLAGQVSLSGEHCAALAPHFDDRERWNDVLSDTSRAVGIRPGLDSFDAYAQRLIGAPQ